MSTPTPDPGAVRLSVQTGIARVTFDRPASRNAITWNMYDELAEVCRTIDQDRSIRVAVLHGAGGKAFVAGTDIEQFRSFTSGRDGVAYEERIDHYISALETLRVPSIAVVEGWAVGGGLALANACDFRIAATGARFGAPIARTLGNCLSPANLRRLTATLGVAWVKRMILSAEMPTAEELAPLGYVSSVVAPEDLDARVDELCARLIDHAPITLRVTRDMLRRLAAQPDADATDLIEQCYGSEDFRMGVSAFMAKTTPKWLDR